MTATALIALAHELLADGRREQASACLDAALKIEPANLDAHNLREAHGLANAIGPHFGIDASIDPQDEIFRFFANHPSSLNPLRDYLADGWRTLSELLRLAEAIDRRLCDCRRFLEFASGYGRFTRHLVKALPAGALHVSDLMPGSVDFLRAHFGAQGFQSDADPARLAIPGAYDFIFVLSLFSHLPHSSWQTWLAHLYGALEPGGVLVISTHGEHFAAASRVELPAEGHLFFAESESTALDGEVYGVCFTSTDYVAQAIASLPGKPQSRHFPAHFWDSQDGWVIFRE